MGDDTRVRGAGPWHAQPGGMRFQSSGSTQAKRSDPYRPYDAALLAAYADVANAERASKMTNDRLFRELCKPEIMKIGWHLAQGDSRDDFVLDPIGHADFASGLTDRLHFLIEQVAAHRYRPRHLIEVDVPKSGLSVRPGNVLPIEEASLLHAIIYLLAPVLDPKIDKSVYSYRLHPKWKARAKRGEALFREVDIEIPFLKRSTLRSINVFEAWYERWPQFEHDARMAVTEDGFTHLTKTDISAYFENIDLRLLQDQIRALIRREEETLLQLLFRILEGWTRTTSAGMPIGRGIPQGNEVSSFLGNVYLIPLDRALSHFCARTDARWFRYVDDVKVFTRNDSDARSVVFIINEALRSLHLNLQGSKTEILSGASLRTELDSVALDTVESVFQNVRSLSPENPAHQASITDALKSASPLCKRFTQGLPASIRSLKGKENRLFRRLLAVYGTAKRSRKHMPEAALEALKALPDLRVLRSALRYLAQLPYSSHEANSCRLLDMLEKEELLFPYQAGAVLESLIQMHPHSPQTFASRIRHYAFGANLRRKRDWLIITKGLEALSSFPYRERYMLPIVSRFVDHSHPMVRRAAVALLPRCSKAAGRSLLKSLVRHPDGTIGRFALYLDRLHNDPEYVKEELGRIRKGNRSDVSMVRRLHLLYAASMTENEACAAQVLQTLDVLSVTKSSKLQWHWNEIRSRVSWAIAL